MPNEVVPVKIDVDVSSMKSLRTELRAATNEVAQLAKTYGETSTQAQSAAKRAAELKDRIQDSKALIDVFNPDRKFAAFSGAIQGLSGGFTALTGLMGLVGDKSEDLQQSILKVQSALAISQGLSNITELGETLTRVGGVIKTQVISGFNALKSAIGSLGIVGLIATLGTLIISFIKSSNESSALSKKIDELRKSTSDYVEETKKAAEANSILERSMRLLGATDAQIAAQRIANIRNNTIALKQQLNVEQGVLDLRKKVLEVETMGPNLNPFSNNSAKVKEIEEIEAKIKSIGDSISENNLRINEEIAAQQKIGIDATNKLAEKYKTDHEAQIKKGESDAIASSKRVSEIAKQQASVRIQLEQDLQFKLQELNSTAYQKELIELDKYYAETKKKLIENQGSLATLDAYYKMQQSAINTKYLQEQIQANYNLVQTLGQRGRQALNQGRAEDTKNALSNLDALDPTSIGDTDYMKQQLDVKAALLRDYYNQGILNDEQYTQQRQKLGEARIAIDTEEGRNKIAWQQAVGDAAGALSNAIGRQTAVGKALAIAQATINMWLGVTDVLSAKSTLPEPLRTINKVASIATILATGYNAIKNITKVQVAGAASSSSPGSSAPISPTAQVTNTQLNQDQLNQIGNATVRAFVVETDISNNQERIRRLNRSARIG